MSANKLETMHVVAAVLKDAQGRVLIAQRPVGKSMAGWWEFPGGKIESGESPQAALARELREELGLEMRAARPLLQLTHDYPERRVQLDVWNVLGYAGTLFPHEGQAFAWVRPDDLGAWRLLPADAPIVTILCLPSLLLVTPDVRSSAESGFLSALEHSLAAGVEFVQFRAPTLSADRYRALATRVITACRRAGARVVLNSEPALAAELGADGVHLSAARMHRRIVRPLPRSLLVGASCHNEAEVKHATKCGLNYIVLGPVLTTPSHPHDAALSWQGFARLRIASALPVYAIGGMRPEHLDVARQHGAYGIAAMRSLWGGHSPTPS